MESAVDRAAPTPTRARSLGPSVAYEDPMDDSGPSNTRKRPRLDSGDRSYRSMSAEPPNSSTSDRNPREQRPSPLTASTALPSNESEHISKDAILTPTKVTINVREPQWTSSGTVQSSEGAASPLKGTENVADNPAASDGHKASATVSARSSPSRSPEIEVAEVEDMDSEPMHTRWRPLGGMDLIRSKHIQSEMLSRFPHSSGGRNLAKAIDIHIRILEKQDLSESMIFEGLINWIEEYLERTCPLSSYWYDLYVDQRDFWDELVGLVDAMVRRENPDNGTIQLIPSSPVSDSTNVECDLHNFLVAFSGLVLRVVKIDEQTLRTFSEDPGTSPDLVSERYVASLAHVLSHAATFWRFTVDTHRYDPNFTIGGMIRRFADPHHDGIYSLAQISKAQKWQNFDPKFWAPTMIVLQVMDYCYQRHEKDHDRVLLDANCPQALQFFLDINMKVNAMISKQAGTLSLDSCRGLIPKLGMILNTLAASNERIAPEYLNLDATPDSKLSERDRGFFTQCCWKLNILKRCIREGRMEIRVFGVDTMQQDLVDVYQRYITGRPSAPIHPIPAYISNWLLDNNLVDYLVGEDSHPQLMSRCANIIGFLVVTSRYTERETDLLWSRLTTSQDPSTIEVLFNVIQNYLNVATHPTLLNLVSKLKDIPLQLCDGVFYTFSRTLFETLRRTSRAPFTDGSLDSAPYQCCITLIERSAADHMMDTNKLHELQHWAADELRNLLPYGPSESDLKCIYDDCLREIAGHTLYASGAIGGLHTILKHRSGMDWKWLADNSNLTQLLVSDISHFTGSNQLSKSTSVLQDNLNVRFELLNDLLLKVPESITANDAQALWNVTVGSQAFNDQARDAAWSCYVRILGATKARNPFLELCIHDFLPELGPENIVHGSLIFARDVAQYDSKFPQADLSGQEYEQPEKRSVRLLWKMALAIPRNRLELESKAIGMLITQYLDSPGTHRRSRVATQAVHVDLVDRCIGQLTTTAAKLTPSTNDHSQKDAMEAVLGFEEEIETSRLSFCRSMKILQEFVQGVRSYPMYSPEPQSQPTLPRNFNEIRGQPVKIMYQCFSGRSHTEIRTVEVGDLEKVEELVDRFRILTGFAHFTVISRGRKLDIPQIANETLGEAKFHEKGLMLIKKAYRSDAIPDLTPTSGLRPIEIAILVHFPDLYELLDLEKSLAGQVFTFLNAFPPHESVIAMVCSTTSQSDQVFPPAAPFKTLYSAHALRSCLAHHLDHGTAMEELMRHALEIVTTAMMRVTNFDTESAIDVDLNVALALVECFSALVKAFADNAIPFSDPRPLVNHLHAWVDRSAEVSNKPYEAARLVDECFRALLDASINSQIFRGAFVEAGELSPMLRRFLLEEPRIQIRHGFWKTIQNLCSSGPKSSAAPQDLILYIWRSLAAILPQTLFHAERSQQIFEASNLVVRALEPSTRQNLNVQDYNRAWCALLLEHHHTEIVGRDEIDWVVLGLSKLILYSFHWAKSMGETLSIPDYFLEGLFKKHLFPEIKQSVDSSSSDILMPNLHPIVRSEMLLIISTLSKDIDHYQRILELNNELLPPAETFQSWSWGIASPPPEGFHWEPCYAFDRSKSIRSHTGYPGLRNLSNTCYMNSLLTQLFMNPDFRELILRSRVADAEGAQKLLSQTQILFGYMQETLLKAVDTQAIAESIITYDNSAIDVQIQMDVDEFYNLLFDRWENQILDEADKKAFRGFFGGQIVQRIESKQCEHTSERMEPFSAIQCDIHGKSTLMESLNAYVSDDLMVGDNKYSCTSCGTYVNAVKRASFKEIPNNLIFHLKRFDYDVNSGQRNKINTRFEFPQELDMSPYHVDNVQKSGIETSPDVFQLVGVLVHSGSAETGHYYSYVREKRSDGSRTNSWVEFNDVDVSPFDPVNIDEQCFGGWTESTLYAASYLRSWNAYLLFYERIKPFEETQVAQSSLPVRCSLPQQLHQQINRFNEIYLQQYCLFDPAQGLFVKTMLDQLRVLNDGRCSEDHVIEQDAISLALQYVERVLSRTKDCPNIDKMLTALTRNIATCPQCCQIALTWLASHETALRNLILRCPLGKVRRDFALLVTIAIRYLRQQDPLMYGYVEADDFDPDPTYSPMLFTEGVLPDILDRLKDLWGGLHLYNRAWDDYFGLLADIADIGKPEVHLMLSKSFLQRCLEILVAESTYARTLRANDLFYQHYNRLLEKGRKYSLVKLVELTANLLCQTNLLEPPFEGRVDERPYDEGLLCLSRMEEELLYLGSRFPARPKDTCVFLDKILNSGFNPLATKRILKTVLLSEPTARLQNAIRNTIQNGISVDPAIHAAPYLRAALVFCECTLSASAAETLIKYIGMEVDSIGKSGGIEHLEFFIHARRLQNPHITRPGKFFHRLVRRTVPLWAPMLLSYPEDSVRLGTIDLLRVLLFSFDQSIEDDEEQEDELTRTGRALCVACARKGENQVQKQEPLEIPKAWDQLIEVTRECIRTFYHDESDDQDQIQQIEGILGNLEALSVSDPEDAPSDNWNNSDNELPTDSDSEVGAVSP